MKRNKQILLIIVGIFLCLFVLREIGIFDLHLYKSRMSSSHSSTLSQVKPGKEEHFSYHVTLKYSGETLDNYIHSYNNLPPTEIEAVLDEPLYSGNYVLPLVKNFKMTYLCKITTMKSLNGYKAEGKIEGEVEGRIHGLCSQRKAKELAVAEAKKQIASYFQKL